MSLTYADFIARKSQLHAGGGFEPSWLPDVMFDFQRDLVEWSLRRGRSAIFADCGLGKTLMQLVWAQNVVSKTNRPVLVLTPLAVARQTIAEGMKFGIRVRRPAADGAVCRGINVTNYERMHHLSPDDFSGVVCDESSILKHFSGATQSAVTRFMLKIPYRLLCTATAAPNDYTELGTSAEALGELGYVDMLSRFFVKIQGSHHALQNRGKEREHMISPRFGHWRLKGHAHKAFWRWVASWARACRMPSDLGFPDDGFVLPELIERHHIVEPHRPPDGMLFVLPAFGLKEEREERRRTIVERCEQVAALVDHDRPAVVWCHLNAEGDALERAIPGAQQITGSMELDER